MLKVPVLQTDFNIERLNKEKNMILEVDLCLASIELIIPVLDSLTISNKPLTSDHLPVKISLNTAHGASDLLPVALKLAKELEDHAVLYSEPTEVSQEERRKRILNSKGQKLIWKFVNWKGEI